MAAMNITARITIFICSLYSFTFPISWSSGTIVCRYHPMAASTQFHIPAPIVV